MAHSRYFANMKRFFPSLALILGLLPFFSQGQTIGTFTSVEPLAQDESLYIPSTHTFQLLIAAGDNLTAGGTMPINSDFTGYVPINGSSENAYLGINSEFIPGGHTVLDIQYNTSSKLWEVSASEAIDFSDLGNLVLPGTSVNCSGAVTPWGTLITCEENVIAGDLNFDGYLDYGWNIEIDPVSKEVVDHTGDNKGDKLWAMGRMKHENIVVAQDSQTVYFGDDDAASGYVYKYICNQKANLYSGDLYVLQQIGTTGTWIQMNNSTQADLNNTIALSDSAGGTKFNRVEDVDIGPDGKVYFASTGVGRVYRFDDNGSTVSNFEVFVENQPYDINYPGGVKSVNFDGADNLVFDGDGNLWITQDASDKHIWMVRPGHSSSNPEIEIFANTPAGCEPTGITFSPDYRFMFLSIQHPATGNQAEQLDAAGRNVRFNRDATLVIALKENLGSTNSAAAPALPEPGLRIEKLHPNPTADLVTVRVKSLKNAQAEVIVYNVKGQRVLQQSKDLRAGINTLKIEARDFAAGKYYLSIRTAEYSTGKKFLRQ